MVRRALAHFRSPESVFTRIYRENLWGGAPDTICSGGGSHDAVVTDAYLEMLRGQAEIHAFENAVFVDLGCGDMNIGRQLIPLCREFIGVDVVRFLVGRHQAEMGGERVRFHHCDIVADELPEGDVCFLRQVLQHLSNKQITAVLPKLRKYGRVYVTEHLPSAASLWTANFDKPQGAGIRLDHGSGVVITRPPFGVPPEEVRVVLEVRGNVSGDGHDPGVIQTVCYTPGRRAGIDEGREVP